MKKVNIIDSTLRDGSYEVNFSFTANDTSLICQKLEEAGVEFIEIGHGLSMGARAYPALAGSGNTSDEEYMIAAESVLKKAKFGMFFYPGISKMEHLDLAARHKMGFIRIGTNVTEVASSEPYIKKAKDVGLFVTANYMKSYALGPEQLAQQIKLSEQYGADVVYLVDSAGYMLPDDIRRYYNAIRKISKIKLGFHGHDNLGLAVANSLAAAEAGFEFIDGTLQGLGRSSGNASTEILVAVLSKIGYETGVDFLKLSDVGERYIQPRTNRKGRNRLDVVAGFAGFHSSFLPLVMKYAGQHEIDPARLIIEVSKKNRIHVDAVLIEQVIQDIKRGRGTAAA